MSVFTSDNVVLFLFIAVMYTVSKNDYFLYTISLYPGSNSKTVKSMEIILSKDRKDSLEIG